MPLWRALRRFPAAEHARAYEALVRVGIERCAWQRASTLSGGQQQRAAIARALVQRRRLILADEPIASLDPESSRQVMELLAALNRELGVHRAGVAAPGRASPSRYCPRTVALRAGEVVYDGPSRGADRRRAARALRRADRRTARTRPTPDAAAERAGCRLPLPRAAGRLTHSIPPSTGALP